MERQKAASGRSLPITCWQLRLDPVIKGRRCGACLGRRCVSSKGNAKRYLEASKETVWENVIDGQDGRSVLMLWEGGAASDGTVSGR